MKWIKFSLSEDMGTIKACNISFVGRDIPKPMIVGNLPRMSLLQNSLRSSMNTTPIRRGEEG
jgi:hypothetical protein